MESDQSFESSNPEGDPLGSPVDGGKNTSSFGKRLAGTLRGSRHAFAEIAGDRAATWHAVAIILVTGILKGVFGIAELEFLPSSNEAPSGGGRAFGGATALIDSLLSAVLSAVLLTFVIRIAAKRFGRRSPAYDGWFRVLGFTSAVTVLDVIPIVGWIAATVYSLVLLVRATRELADTSTWRSLAIVLIAVVGYFLFMVVLGFLFAAVGALIGTFENPFA